MAAKKFAGFGTSNKFKNHCSRLNEKHVLHSSERCHFIEKETSSFCLILKKKNNLSIVTMYQNFSAN